MEDNETNRKLATITDEGLFERLATAVLREAEPRFASLVHPGVNAEGKTVKAPLDGFTFIPGANPPHMIAVHHTITARNDLEKKWLHDPATVKPRKGGKPTAPPGDLVKTAAIVTKERVRSPGLLATLVLTTNHDPSDALVRDVTAAGAAANITIEIWGRSRIAHILDTGSTGQWLRRQYLGIEQERLSPELLHELSVKSIEQMRLPGDAASWVTRQLDRDLAARQGHEAVFVVAGSGLGKSVACHKFLSAHVSKGGAGLVVPHEIVAGALSFEEAIELTLRALHPRLPAGCRADALDISSMSPPLVVVVEDVSKSGNPALLLEKIASWARTNNKPQGEPAWRVFCPVWPQVLSSLGDEARKQIEAMALHAGPFTAGEALAAVKRRAVLAGRQLTDVAAGTIAEALGNDPLLIALHDPEAVPEPRGVIGRYIDASIGRSAAMPDALTAGEYRDALRRLGSAMLRHASVAPVWATLSPALGLTAAEKDALRALARRQEVIRIAGEGRGEHIAFRHDRVRDAILIDAGHTFMTPDLFARSGLDDPYFAEIAGAVLANVAPSAATVSEVAARNPLALIYALREFQEPRSEGQHAIVSAIGTWLDSEAADRPSTAHLRWHAQSILAETDSSLVTGMAARLPDKTSWHALRARFRNGDFGAGLALCWRLEPGVRASGHLELIRHVREHRGPALLSFLDAQLRRGALPTSDRVGALRLAGYLADASLGDAIANAWSAETDQLSLIGEYLWAASTCCGDEPARLLGPICALWTTLPDDSDREYAAPPRVDVVDGSFRFAFQEAAPARAIGFLIEKARSEAGLLWPVTYLMDGVDHPDAVEFVARELAAIEERLDGTDGISLFSMQAGNDWQRRQENAGTAMSEVSRARLSRLWQDRKNNKLLRRAAFKLWAATIAEGDIAVLRPVGQEDELYDRILFQRARRGDRQAIPDLVVKLAGERSKYWWQCGRYIWSDELTAALDRELERRGHIVTREWDSSYESDWIVAEQLMRIPVAVAEGLLTRHWEHLRYSSNFVQAALYLATPTLKELAAQSLSECPEPGNLLKYISMRFGIKTVGRAGVTKISQVEALVPYLDLLDDMAIRSFWGVCNECGWFAFRKEHLDGRLATDRMDLVYTSDERAMSALLEIVEKNGTIWIEHWLDSFLATGAPLSHVMGLFADLVKRRPSIDTLRLAADALIHVGNRSHFGALRAIRVEPADDAAAVLADAEFAVRRRSLI